MVLFILELNGLQPYTNIIGNAFLEAYTTEKLWIIVLIKFGDQAGHLLIVNKVLYELSSSGQHFNEHLGECLYNLDFRQTDCKANIWIGIASNVYKYVTTYVDNLCLAVKEPLKFLHDLTQPPYNFKLKGSQSI